MSPILHVFMSSILRLKHFLDNCPKFYVSFTYSLFCFCVFWVHWAFCQQFFLSLCLLGVFYPRSIGPSTNNLFCLCVFQGSYVLSLSCLLSLCLQCFCFLCVYLYVFVSLMLMFSLCMSHVFMALVLIFSVCLCLQLVSM